MNWFKSRTAAKSQVIDSHFESAVAEKSRGLSHYGLDKYYAFPFFF